MPYPVRRSSSRLTRRKVVSSEVNSVFAETRSRLGRVPFGLHPVYYCTDRGLGTEPLPSVWLRIGLRAFSRQKRKVYCNLADTLLSCRRNR